MLVPWRSYYHLRDGSLGFTQILNFGEVQVYAKGDPQAGTPDLDEESVHE